MSHRDIFKFDDDDDVNDGDYYGRIFSFFIISQNESLCKPQNPSKKENRNKNLNT